MAGRGPAPKDPATRVRRNKTGPTSRVAADGRLRGPALPKSGVYDSHTECFLLWHPQTVSWWNNWRRSPQASTFTATDWDYLLDTALMHHKMWANGRWDFASEVRLRVAKFGATPEDRMRLKMELETPGKRQPVPVPAGVTEISSRRKRLSG
jgi:hypothetical protein